MRRDVASILTYLGYMPERDFDAVMDAPGSVVVKWYAQAAQPDERAIDAAALELQAAEQAIEAKRVESDMARAEVKQAYSELQPLIEHKDPAIALLASIMQKHLLATLGR